MEEKTTTRNIKRAAFTFLMLMLILPGIQFKFNIINFKSLGGAYQYAERPGFNWKDFDTLGYQKNYEKYINDHVGMRELFLRSYNQVWFSFFRMVHASAVVLGKNKCLYELNYIKEYTGKNFIGEEAINERLMKAKFLQDTLAKKNIHLVLLFAPGKASFYPENIPDTCLANAKPQTNYKYYVKGCREYGLNFIDMSSWFTSMKGKTKYPIYSNAGIHWTQYGATLVFDSLMKYMERMQGAPLPKMVVDSFELTDVPRLSDDDIEKGLNLLFPFHHDNYAYPVYHFEEVKGMQKPSVLTVADSYWWNIFGQGLTVRAFNGSSFWFYNHDAYYDDNRPMKTVDSMDMQRETEKYDFIILLATEANLFGFSYKYIERMYDIYKGKGDTDLARRRFEELVKLEEGAIRNTPDWFQLVREKARKQNLPLDTMLRRDAIYVVNAKRNQK
jgi:hypothetical protein